MSFGEMANTSLELNFRSIVGRIKTFEDDKISNRRLWLFDEENKKEILASDDTDQLLKFTVLLWDESRTRFQDITAKKSFQFQVSFEKLSVSPPLHYFPTAASVSVFVIGGKSITLSSVFICQIQSESIKVVQLFLFLLPTGYVVTSRRNCQPSAIDTTFVKQITSCV